MQGTQEAPGTCGSRGLCSVTQEHGGCHVWDTGTWRMPRVGHGDVEGATRGTRGVWRVPRVGQGGVEDATHGTRGVEDATCGTWGRGGCHTWDTSRATHAAGGNAMSGTLRTLKKDCFPQGVGRHLSQRLRRVWKFML